MNDVVIGAVKGHSWAEVEPYAVSLSRCFAGTKLMFVSETQQGTKAILSNMGFRLVDMPPLPFPTVHFCIDRFYAASEWLKQNPSRYVVWTDVRDVVFQTDPAAWLAANKTTGVVVGSECVAIKDEPSNRQWMSAGFGDAPYEECVLNSGTLAGDGESMQRMLAAIYDTCSTLKPFRPGGDYRFAGINDQAMLNFLVRKRSPFKETTRIPQQAEGFSAVCNALGQPHKYPGKLMDERPEMRSGLLVNSKGMPFSIVHQYDRHPEWRSAITSKYRSTR